MKRTIALATIAMFVVTCGAVGCGGGPTTIKSVDATNNARPTPTAGGGGKKGSGGPATSAPPAIK